MSQPIGFTKSGTPGQQLVINQLVIRPPRRSSSDVGEWRSALRAWDYGRRTQMLDLYEDILIDNVLSESIDKRVRAITNATLVFQKDGVSVPEVEAIIDTQAFEDLLTELLWSKFRGKTVTELSFVNGFEAFPIPAKNLRPLTGTIALDQSSNGIINYRNEDFFIEAGKDKDLGLLYRLAPLVIYKRGGFGDWSQYVELFGMPQRIGKYSAYDETSRKLLIEALENAGSAPYAVIPKETDIETIERKGSTGQTSLYNEFRQACNEEMLIGVLGQTMTTLNGSSKSQSETHMDVEEDLHASDQRYVARILNSQLVPRLEKRGFPVKSGKFTFPEKGENISLKDRIDIDTKVNEKVPFTKKYWYKTYGVDEPKDGEETTGGVQQEQAPPPTPPQKGGEAAPIDKTAPADKKTTNNTKLSDELSLLERVLSFFFTAPAQKVTGATALTGGNHLTTLASNVNNFNFIDLLQRITEAQKAGKPLTFDLQLHAWTTAKLIEAFRAGWNSKDHRMADVGFAYGLQNDMVQTAMEMNLYYFSAGRNLAEMIELNRLFRESKSFADFVQKGSSVNGTFNTTWMQTEYDTAYLSAESSATYYRLKQQADMFPYWQYLTVADGHVRIEHAVLHGLILPYNDKRWAKIYPPNGWNCRCYVVGILKDEANDGDITKGRDTADNFLKTDDFKKAEKSGWGVNRAETKQVFTTNQQYVDDKTGKKLFNMTYQNYSLPDIATIQANSTNIFKSFEGNASEWYKTLPKVDESPVLTDYAGRNLVFDKDTFDNHISKTGRETLLSVLVETTSNPDEVWLNSYKVKTQADNYVFIKYYNNKTVVINAQIKGGKYSIETWYELAPKAEAKVRKGILVKKQ